MQSLETALGDILKGIQDTMQSGEILSDEFQGQLAQTITALTTRIDELRGQTVPPIPPLEKSIPSSVINAFKYDPKNGKLLVQFKGKFPNEEGSIYSYGGVPPQVFDLFRRGAIPAKSNGKNAWGTWWRGKAPSAGSSMNVLLKSLGFPYQKIT